MYGTSAGETNLPGHWLPINNIDLRFFLVYELSAADRTAGVNELTELLERGHRAHTVARRLPLEAVADAHELVERGEVMGNVVLDIP